MLPLACERWEHLRACQDSGAVEQATSKALLRSYRVKNIIPASPPTAMSGYGPPPGAYGGGQSYGPPGGNFQPPGMGMGMGMPMPMPPGFGAPGLDLPPGMAAQSPGGMQGQFQPPPNMPNINFNAPVIRLGVDAQRNDSPNDRRGGDRGGRGRDGNAESMGNRGRMGLGAQGGDRNLDRERQQVRESMMAMQPPTREEVARTIFIGGLGAGAPHDDILEAILRCPGKLRRWVRARDADDKNCKFGFAEYEDVESLEAAAESLPNLELPLFNADGTVQREEGEEGEVKKMRLLVVVDEASQKYIQEWMGRRKEDENQRQFRMDSAKDELRSTITNILNTSQHAANGTNGVHDGDGDTTMGDANGDAKADGVEIVTIPGSLEDELADIPVEMRATVAEEIKAFRDRSNRRDIERLRREEEMEREERQRAGMADRARINRLASPPPNGAPAGPGGINGIPVGPRGQQGVQGAPVGPKGYRGAQLPNDYVNGVAFVPGAGRDGRGIHVSVSREDDDAEESDRELERQRQEKKSAALEQEYQDHVKRWQARERQRGMAQERERNREEAERRNIEKAKDEILHRLANWNDDEEAAKGKELYYRDRSAWARAREAERNREARDDDADRKQEEREKANTRRQEAEAKGLADDFLGQMGVDMQGPAANEKSGPAGFKISLGNAAKTKQSTSAHAGRRAIADVEGLLEDEEDAAASGTKRLELKELQDTSTVPVNGADLTDDERAAARQQLASEIPHESEKLYAHTIKWDSLSQSLIDAQIRPFVERKVVEYLGLQEESLVNVVLDGIRDKRSPTAIRDEIEEALDDEAELLMRKVWRLLIFLGECESRGLAA
ncbi:hypothetical protein AC578_10251 [Pseudocercospora eumusae]|uniref:PWI domain-containing protein n=1 Tax=Pseudocercospora eumusae TaxID=321146 RepID=A0A139HYX2_9PEZI|nr:hypothetical protein AC578_10251 [Pseudocercospora eumusae]